MNPLDRFLSLIDRRWFSATPVSTTVHAYDATNRFSLPDGVVRPGNAEELQTILQAATAARIPIFPRGAGTGFSGGSVPTAGGIVLDFLGMNRLIDLDEAGMTAVVEPGLVTLRLAEAAEERGLFYPPDPASIKTCTIGGNVAENAGGPHCLKYGVTRDYILSIDAFTMAGDPFRAGRAVHKNRAGYDLRHLLIGSEGTLAVFSQFTVKLIPRPEDKMLFLAFFADFNEATRMVNTLYQNGIQPSSLEFMDEFAIRAVDRHSGLGLPAQVKALLYIEVDGRRDDMPFLQTRIETCLQGSVVEVRLARDHAEQERLWEIRRKTSPAMRQFGNTKANEDIVVPRPAIPEAIAGLREISERLRLNIINFGHIGDGNIHVNIMYDGQNEDESRRAHLGITEVFALVNRLGGAISGEHGIGLAKKTYLPANLDPVSLDLMKRIKRQFDPLNLLNPGKIFDLP